MLQKKNLTFCVGTIDPYCLNNWDDICVHEAYAFFPSCYDICHLNFSAASIGNTTGTPETPNLAGKRGVAQDSAAVAARRSRLSADVSVSFFLFQFPPFHSLTFSPTIQTPY